MKTINLMLAMLTLTACESQPLTETVPARIIQSPAIGSYRHHQGEINHGTVTISPKHIRIDTDRLNLDIDVTQLPADSLQVNPDCWIFVYLSTKKLKLSLSHDRITVWIMDKNQTELYYGDTGYYGTFDRITEPEPTINN